MSADDAVIVMHSAVFHGSELDARDILLAEIVKMHPLHPAESDIALAYLQRAVRKRIGDVKLSITTLDELTRTPLLPTDICFLIRALPASQKSKNHTLGGAA